MRAAVLLGFVALVSCSPYFANTNSSQNSLDDTGPTPIRPVRERFFGYYASQMDGIGTLEDLDELKDKSNFVFIASGELDKRLQRCRELGLKAMVHFPWLLFDEQMRLFDDWQTRVKWATDIMDQYLDVIIAFYPVDEPYLNGDKIGRTVDEIYQSLETVGSFFKSRYPQLPIAVIFSAVELNKGFRLPPSFDWFGMDCYDNFFRCERATVPSYYDKLKVEMAKLEAVDQRSRFLMAVPPAGYEVSNPENEAKHLNQVPYYRKLVKDEEKIKVVIPFIWQTFSPENGGWHGARTSPKLKDAYVQFYRDFLAESL
jgi:hypothetical protein